MKKKSPPSVDSFVRWQLRRISLRWPASSIAMARARIARGLYKCELCGNNMKAKDVNRDHIEPIVPIDRSAERPDGSGRMDWNLFIDRLLCGPEGIQIICPDCHDKKTQEENEIRRKLGFGLSRKRKNGRKDVSKKTT